MSALFESAVWLKFIAADALDIGELGTASLVSRTRGGVGLAADDGDPGAVAASVERVESLPLFLVDYVGFDFVVSGSLCAAFAANDDDFSSDGKGGIASSRGRKLFVEGAPRLSGEVVDVHRGDGAGKDLVGFLRCLPSASEVEFTVKHSGLEVIACVRGVGELGPLIGFGVVDVVPRDESSHVATCDAGAEVYLSFEDAGARATASSSFGDFWPHAPSVCCRIVDQDRIDRRFVREATGHGADDPNFVLVDDGLKMVNLDGGFGSLSPCVRGGIENADWIDAATSEQIGFFLYCDESCFVAGDGFANCF